MGYEAQGVQIGMQQGVQQGEALALQKILVKRFGAIPAQVTAQIASADASRLDAWLDQVLDAPSMESMFGPLMR